MTHRTTLPEKSRVELAVHEVLEGLNQHISAVHAQHKLPITDEEFRRVIARYLFAAPWPDMCSLLRIQPHPGDNPSKERRQDT
jgi:hypothetical protein